jgi:ATP-dependent exoDNAse (exonuclease V) alpha subunit
VEKKKKRVDARLAREVEIALPNELTQQEQIKLVREYVNDNFVSHTGI